MSEFSCNKCFGVYDDFYQYETHICMPSSSDKQENKEEIKQETKQETIVIGNYVMEGSKFKCNACSKLYANEKTFGKHACKPPAPKVEKPKIEQNIEPTVGPTKEEEDKKIENKLAELKISNEPKPKPEKKFKCDECNKAWATQRGLDNHDCKPPKEKEEYTCDDCKRVFKTEKGYTSHECKPKKVKEPKGDYICDACKNSYKTEKGFEKHKCVPKVDITCDACKKVYKSQKTFDTHVCEKLECEKCHKIFSKKLGFNKHIEANKCVVTK